jgi:2-dehydropantoate 2-reductase
MRALVLGAGATGGYFGSRLIAAGHDVGFLVRPARALRLASEGLRVQATKGVFAAPVNAFTEIAIGDAWDLVILSCKAYDLDSAIAAIAPAIGPKTQVLPLLNGLRHLDALDAAFGASRVLGGLCHISVALDAEGVIQQVGSVDRLTFGARSPAQVISPAVRDGLLAMQVDVRESDDILGAMWNKFTFLSALAGITCLLHGTIGEIAAAPDGAALASHLYFECAETARRSDHAPAESAIAEAIGTLTATGSPLKASMLRDLDRGATTEVEHVLGDMLARAQALEVDAPLLAAACTRLRIHEKRLA